jgi:dihydroxy-acid dehydratase
LDKAEIERRFKGWKAVEPKIKTGYLSRYLGAVESADKGAVLR